METTNLQSRHLLFYRLSFWFTYCNPGDLVLNLIGTCACITALFYPRCDELISPVKLDSSKKHYLLLHSWLSSARPKSILDHRERYSPLAMIAFPFFLRVLHWCVKSLSLPGGLLSAGPTVSQWVGRSPGTRKPEDR